MLVTYCRRMYQSCNLVHGDLSEYNILWYNESPVIIDVSQSVEHAHPLAHEFLRKDISNIFDFFAKRGLKLLSKYQIFQFVVDKYLVHKDISSMKPESDEEVMNMLEQVVESHKDDDDDVDEQDEDGEDNSDDDAVAVDEAVFMQSYIPTSLNEISNPHQEAMRMKNGYREAAYTAAIKNMLGGEDTTTKSRAVESFGSDDDSISEDSDSDRDSENLSSDEDDDESAEDEDDEDGLPRREKKKSDKYLRHLPSHSNPEERRLAKENRKLLRKASKELSAEKRKHKLPKHLKKKAIKNSKKK